MNILKTIQEEHRHLWHVAAAIEWSIEQLHVGKPINEDFYTALFDYLREFMGASHRLKETEFLFPQLEARLPELELGPVFEVLRNEYDQGAEKQQQLRSLLVLGNLPENARYIQDLTDYAALIKNHIQIMERKVLAPAERKLSPDDWDEISRGLEESDNELIGEQADMMHRELYHRIVSLAPDEIGLGGTQAGRFSHLVKGAGAEPLLQVKDMESSYGAVKALKGISLEVHKGELVALIGANGAGKTTFLHTLSGVQPMSAGQIRFARNDITHMRADLRVKEGICHSPEGRQVFGPMSIEDNLRLGAYLRAHEKVDKDLDRVYGMFPILHEKRHLPAGTLSGGQQQMLAISRALMGRPRLLLLDEPSMGLAPLLVEEVFNVIETLKSQGMTILLVEQNALAALRVADRAYVLETGNVVLSGTGREMINDESVRAAYLGM